MRLEHEIVDFHLIQSAEVSDVERIQSTEPKHVVPLKGEVRVSHPVLARVVKSLCLEIDLFLELPVVNSEEICSLVLDH